MPSGRIHTMSTIALAMTTVPLMSIPLTAGVLTGCVLSPDLDVDSGFIGLAHLRRFPMVGPLISGLWRVFWWPYSRLAPHRSHISHSIFFGTVLRVAYLMVPLLAINVMGIPLSLPDWFGMWFVGLCSSDGLHILMDKI